MSTFPSGVVDLKKGFPPTPVEVIWHSVLLRFLTRNLKTLFFLDCDFSVFKLRFL